MPHPSVPVAPQRRRINLTIREDVIAEAKALSLNTSQAAGAGIREAVRQPRGHSAAARQSGRE